jgi:hypothetical protein
VLTLWVIYYGASNHPPGKWVVRAQDAQAPLAGGVLRAGETEHGIRPHATFYECDSLAEARAKIPIGLVRMPHHEGLEDPVIVETWL